MESGSELVIGGNQLLTGRERVKQYHRDSFLVGLTVRLNCSHGQKNHEREKVTDLPSCHTSLLCSDHLRLVNVSFLF